MARVLADLYRRSPVGYVALLVALALIVITGLSAFVIGVYIRALALSADGIRLFFVAAEGAIVLGFSLATWRTVRHESGPLDWVRGRRGQDAAIVAWDGLSNLPVRIVMRFELLIGVIVLPAIVAAVGPQVHYDALSLAVLVTGMLCLQVGCGAFTLMLFDVAVRPIRVEIDDALPRDFVPTHAPRPSSRRLIAEVSATSYLSAVLTGVVLLPVDTGPWAIMRILLMAAALTAGLALLYVAGFAERVSGPIRELVGGTRAVADGDLSARLPLAGADEHLLLAQSFNSMVAGLREREALHSAMGSYVDPAIAERVMAEGARIAGESVEVTVMFLDIVGFTSLAEDQPAEAVVSDLNEFFDIVIPAIERNGGHANKLLGDGLMAVFGAPLPLEDHADKALRAARQIEAALIERYQQQLRVGIGLHSGTVVVGSMGGGRKLDYTIIGDVVNVTARVEAYTRQTGDTILLTDGTKALLSADESLESRGSQALKGRAAEVHLWAA